MREGDVNVTTRSGLPNEKYLSTFVLTKSLLHLPRNHSRCNWAVMQSCSSMAASKIASKNMRPRSEARNREVVKKKVALVVGYDGAGYHGFQRNADVTTVSDILERAMHSAGAISDDNFGSLEKIKWQVSARTDRGVSAAGNVVSAKLLFPRSTEDSSVAFDALTGCINENLPQEVRVFGMQHITASFSARTSCGERWYEYLLPAEALKGSRSLEALEYYMRLYEGTHWFHNYTIGADHTIPTRAQASRYIVKARCGLEPIRLKIPGLVGSENSGSEWIRILVRGQSFMLHQIRKMVSMAVLAHNRSVPHDAIEQSFSRDVLINIPPAPAVGLFLDCCHFDWYNERHKAILTEPVSVHGFEAAREKFKLDYIIPSIARRAVDEDALGIFFRTVDAHPVFS